LPASVPATVLATLPEPDAFFDVFFAPAFLDPARVAVFLVVFFAAFFTVFFETRFALFLPRDAPDAAPDAARDVRFLDCFFADFFLVADARDEAPARRDEVFFEADFFVVRLAMASSVPSADSGFIEIALRHATTPGARRTIPHAIRTDRRPDPPDPSTGSHAGPEFRGIPHPATTHRTTFPAIGPYHHHPGDAMTRGTVPSIPRPPSELDRPIAHNPADNRISHLDPRSAWIAWPETAPLVMLRWTLPPRADTRDPARQASTETRWTLLATPTDAAQPASIPELTTLLASTRRLGSDQRLVSPISPANRQSPGPSCPPPFTGGWIGWLGYDLGHTIEPTARVRSSPNPDRPWPIAELLRCPGAYAYDHGSGRWWVVGDPDALPPLPVHSAPASTHRDSTDPAARMELDELASSTGRDLYIASAQRCVELIHAGDAFQINLAHRLSARFHGSTRVLADRLFDAAQPAYGAILERPGQTAQRATVVSVSPELLCDLEPATRAMITRPMKGTRPGHADPAELDLAPKDRAELAMIVDLMRNDLGRVAEFGSVRVDHPRAIERHARGSAGVLQAVATVSARLAQGVGVAEMLSAILPAGSITGAPKVRAMQIIDELEPVRRGPYCGSVAWFCDHGHASLNVAIRTASVTGTGPADRPGWVDRGVLDYPVGAGIVADSDPASEWRETLDKAGPIRTLAPIADDP